MTMDPTNRVGRFTNDQGSGVLPGMSKSSSLTKTLGNKQLKRSLKPYLKYLPKNLNKLKNYSTGELEAIATRAVMKKRKNKPKKLRTSFNTKKYNVKQAKRVMAMKNPTQKQLKATRKARKHIKWVRRNRQVMKQPLWGSDLPKGATWGKSKWG